MDFTELQVLNMEWKDTSKTPEAKNSTDLNFKESDVVLSYCSDGVLRLAKYRVYNNEIEPDWRTADSDSWFVDVKWWIPVPQVPKS